MNNKGNMNKASDDKIQYAAFKLQRARRNVLKGAWIYARYPALWNGLKALGCPILGMRGK